MSAACGTPRVSGAQAAVGDLAWLVLVVWLFANDVQPVVAAGLVVTLYSSARDDTVDRHAKLPSLDTASKALYW